MSKKVRWRLSDVPEFMRRVEWIIRWGAQEQEPYWRKMIEAINPHHRILDLEVYRAYWSATAYIGKAAHKYLKHARQELTQKKMARIPR